MYIVIIIIIVFISIIIIKKKTSLASGRWRLSLKAAKHRQRRLYNRRQEHRRVTVSLAKAVATAAALDILAHYVVSICSGTSPSPYAGHIPHNPLPLSTPLR